LALWSLLGGALISAGGGLFSFIALGDPRATGPLEDPNDLAYVLAAAVPIALVRLGTAATRRAALALAAALALLLAGAGATVSRGGAIAIGLVLLWVAARRIVPLQLFAWGLGLLALLGTGVALIAQDQIQTALNQKSYIAASNVETRNLRWQSALRLAAHYPVFGAGPGAARLRYVEFSQRAEIAESTPVTHEMYLEVAAELGLPGFACFVGAIAAGVVGTELTVRRRRRLGARPDDPLLLAAYAVQGSLIAVCGASLFLSEEFYMPLWAALAASAALELRSRPRRVPAAPRARAVVA
jgi:O-antigen ligase